jgi:hypothetical protein
LCLFSSFCFPILCCSRFSSSTQRKTRGPF